MCVHVFVGYLANAAGPVPSVLDLRIAHDRFGRSSDPYLNGHLHDPNDKDGSSSLKPFGTLNLNLLWFVVVGRLG